MIDNRGDFIRAHTRILKPPHCPELTLHLADDAVDLWRLTEEELGEIGLPPPFWAFAWAGGQALARYLLDSPHVVAGRRVLDVASGSGLVAIAAMKAGAASALAADIDAFAAEAARLNAALNDVRIAAATFSPLGEVVDAQTILVGDLFYEQETAAKLLTWLREASAGGADVLVGDPGRYYFPKSAFAQIAEYKISVSRALEDADIKRTGVWRLVN